MDTKQRKLGGVELRWRALAAPLPACLALAAAGCGDVAGNAVAPDDPNARVAAVSLAGIGHAMHAGDTVQLTGVARDAGGREVAGARLDWRVSDDRVAQVSAGGRLVALGHGPVLVSVSAGAASDSARVEVTLTSESRRFAWVVVDDPSARDGFRPAAGRMHNETGGGALVARRAAGEYVVTFERLAKVDSAFRETVLVTPYGRAGERCHPQGWENAPNGRDLEVSVSCFGFSGQAVDSRFSVLVVGSRTLASRMAFTVTGDAATNFAPQPSRSFTSHGSAVAVNRAHAGSYLVRTDAASNGTAGDAAQSYFVSTHGGANALCKVSSWSGSAWAGVLCYAPGGALTDSRFSILLVEGGRPGRRFGFAWASHPATPPGTSYSPSLQYQRSSSGDPARITRLSVGRYRVSFPGLAHGAGAAASGRESVHVSSYGGGPFACQVADWESSSAALGAIDVTVHCWNAQHGLLADTYFTTLLLE